MISLAVQGKRRKAISLQLLLTQRQAIVYHAPVSNSALPASAVRVLITDDVFDKVIATFFIRAALTAAPCIPEALRCLQTSRCTQRRPGVLSRPRIYGSQ